MKLYLELKSDKFRYQIPYLHYRQSKEDLGKKQPKQETNCTITLYSNGFIVNDGSFRDYNDPTNKKFMEDINKGYSL